MTVIDNEEIRTLYYDKADVRFVYIVWNPRTGRAQHHKLPKSILSHQVDEANEWVVEHKY